MCCRWGLSIGARLSTGGERGDWRYLPLDASGRGFWERKENENEPRNIMVRFVTHQWGICHPSRLFRLFRCCVASPLPPPPRLDPRPCYLTRPPSSSLCHPPDSPIVDVVACVLSLAGSPRLPPSPDLTSIGTNPPTSL